MYLYTNYINNKLFIAFFNLQYIEIRKGHFIDIDTGQIVGEHNGLHKWTVGQRCRLQNWKLPYFIFKKDIETNNIYVVRIYFVITVSSP